MTNLPVAIPLVVAAMLAWAGWFLLFRAASIIERHRNALHKSAPLHQSPSAALMRKPWFPFVLRSQGLLCWLMALFLLVVSLSPTIFR